MSSTDESVKPDEVESPDLDEQHGEDLDDEDEEFDEELEGRFQRGDWYVIHTYSGYENKVRANLGSRIQSTNMEDRIFDVVIPTEDSMEIKAGKRQVVQKKVFPGYILVRMDLDDDSWYVVRNTPGVTGFAGPDAKPTPLDPMEARQILAPQGPERLRPRVELEVGDMVEVTTGAFAASSGPVADINLDQNRVKVLVPVFGRETPVELALEDIRKI